MKVKKKKKIGSLFVEDYLTTYCYILKHIRIFLSLFKSWKVHIFLNVHIICLFV